MSTPLSIDPIAPWRQSQPAPLPPVAAIQPVAPAPSGAGDSDASTDRGRSDERAGDGGRGAIYVPQRQRDAPLTYAKPPVAQGTIHPEADSGTAATDVAAVNADAPVAENAAIARPAVNAAYAMVMDASTISPFSVLSPPAGGR